MNRHDRKGHTYSHKKIQVATCETQGDRRTMEDAMFVKLPQPDFPYALFGLFDGHGNKTVSNTLKAHVNAVFVPLLSCLKYVNDAMVHETIVRIDGALRRFRMQGCTAVVVMMNVNTRQCRVISVGDSLAVIIGNTKIRQLTPLHTVDLAGERHRITKLAGATINNGRVYTEDDSMGLNLCRSMADSCDKKKTRVHEFTGKTYVMPVECQALTSTPFTATFTLRKGETLLLACDGLTESLNAANPWKDKRFNQQAAFNIQRARHVDGMSRSLDDLVHTALSYSGDNISTMVIRIATLARQKGIHINTVKNGHVVYRNMKPKPHQLDKTLLKQYKLTKTDREFSRLCGLVWNHKLKPKEVPGKLWCHVDEYKNSLLMYGIISACVRNKWNKVKTILDYLVKKNVRVPRCANARGYTMWHFVESAQAPNDVKDLVKILMMQK